MSAIQKLRKNIEMDWFDYTILMDVLKEYAKPRDVVSTLLKKGEILRLKKGLYLFGPDWRRAAHNPLGIANILYGPSYVTREYALSYYGLIPEGVREVTSVTTLRKKDFDTPLGRFSFRHSNVKRYAIGITIIHAGTPQSAMIATKEKAIVDLLHHHRDPAQTVRELFDVLTEGYRIEAENLATLDVALLNSIVSNFSLRSIHLLPKVVDYASKFE